ncbi:uncharacterized protein LOC110465937 isoform X2 [Mizuhopecten yessoensis]|uniref:uncharacterized protein LOC110465937 isoform X2 n=1 Tax=Mizuhopecten yessoensis TaxID=6573 RepID=UPI000B45DB7B|nr:uncharacterized protein LOC110465937 isoform X2 [Mizuhopecten yessoensis]
MKGLVMCPELAKRHIFITKNNSDSFKLTTYRRHPGTSVVISCIAPETHRLKGDPFLKCLHNGHWNKPIPRCIHGNVWDSRFKSPSNDLTIAGHSPQKSAGAISQTEALPYVITVSVLAFMFIALIAAIVYLAYLRRRLETSIKQVEARPAHVRAVDSMTSLPTTTSTAYDFSMNIDGAPYVSSSGTSSPTYGPDVEYPPWNTYPRLHQSRLKLETESTCGSVRYTTVSDYLVYK